MNPRLPWNWRRRRLAWSVALVTLACAMACAVGTARSARHRAIARTQEEQATRAIWEARTRGARRWAPDTLARAERAARDALVVMQANEARLTILADFPAATSEWSSVRSAAEDAARQAVANKRDAQQQSEEAIAAARNAVSRVARTSRLIHLGARGQQDLSRVQLALIESHALYRQGEYLGALRRAMWAGGVAERLHNETLRIADRYFQKSSITRWSRWKTELIARSRRERRPAILIEKADHRLTLYLGSEPVRVYDVELGPNWIAAKTYSGDAATPEGHYHVIAKKDRGESAYHRALLLDYPNDQDRKAFAHARRLGFVPYRAGVGGLVEIHGDGGRAEDWTLGCVAMSNGDLDDLFRRVQVGTPVAIVGGSGQQLYERMGRDDRDRSLALYER